MTRELYQRLMKQPDQRISIHTVLQGPFAGEKLIRQNEQIIYQIENGFFTSYPLNPIEMDGISLRENTEIFTETICGSCRLCICGGGHVSLPIIELGKKLGFHVTVIEDRIDFADRAAASGADRVIADYFEKALQAIPGGNDVYFIIVTRGHKFDEICLREILKKEYAYVGMMGSRRRTAMIRQNLLESGLPQNRIDTLHAPIGLSIKAETPYEIAISIMAEIIEIKNRHRKTEGFTEEIRKYLTDTETDAVMATIIKRRGSAPRQVGTKMLISRKRELVGTIGGGCAEADIIERSMYMLRNQIPFEIAEVDMTADEASEEGMVCGGRLEVMLELCQMQHITEQ